MIPLHKSHQYNTMDSIPSILNDNSATLPVEATIGQMCRYLQQAKNRGDLWGAYRTPGYAAFPG